ncbi:MAG: nuclear transport factor 2 family protein [Emcibacteraceae bacterium]|nr:nuclear transport factor 2 family protein [Emcibacteraceae bacterium]
MKNIIIVVTILIGLIPISLNAQTSDDDFAAAIQAQNDKYMAGYKNKSPELVASVHTMDAIVYPPNRMPVVGRAEILQMAKGDQAMGEYGLILKSVSLERHGDMAIEVGTYEAHIVFPDGSVINDEGNTIVIWKKIDGVWLYYKDIFNSTLPL